MLSRRVSVFDIAGTIVDLPIIRISLIDSSCFGTATLDPVYALVHMSQVFCGLAVGIHATADGGDRQYSQKDPGAGLGKMVLVVREEVVDEEAPG